MSSVFPGRCNVAPETFIKEQAVRRKHNEISLYKMC
jgi:hypothetical protein